jgi:hypothetical protein
MVLPFVQRVDAVYAVDAGDAVYAVDAGDAVVIQFATVMHAICKSTHSFI